MILTGRDPHWRLGPRIGPISPARLDQWIGRNTRDPVFTALVTDGSTTTTSRSVSIGSPAAGETVVVAHRTAAASTVSFPAGWTQLLDQALDGSVDRTVLYYRVCDGTEGANVTVTQGTAVRSISVAWKFTRSTVPIFSPIARFFANTTNPPFISQISAGFVPDRRNLFFALFTAETATNVTADPAGWTLGGDEVNTGSSGAGLAHIRWYYRYARANRMDGWNWTVSAGSHSTHVGWAMPGEYVS